MLKIYTVTDDFFPSVCELFAEQGEVKLLPEKWEDYRELQIDLLVFTGGEDIEPGRYGMTEKSIWFNAKRDAREFSVFSQVMTKRMKVEKVLGICRGLQLINVGFGGSLVIDIFREFGMEHDSMHPLNWEKETPLSILTHTNSMHHQGIQGVGNAREATILAREPKTRLIETIMWGDKYLAVQYHPEFFPDTPLRRDIAGMIASWCKGELELSPKKVQTKPSYSDISEKMKKAVHIMPDFAPETGELIDVTGNAARSMNEFAPTWSDNNTAFVARWGNETIGTANPVEEEESEEVDDLWEEDEELNEEDEI